MPDDFNAFLIWLAKRVGIALIVSFLLAIPFRFAMADHKIRGYYMHQQTEQYGVTCVMADIDYEWDEEVYCSTSASTVVSVLQGLEVQMQPQTGPLVQQ